MSREKENQCLEEFISVYESEKCLWKIKSPEYHDRQKKEAAYKRLIEVWKVVEPNCNRSIVLKKINNIRSTYRKEMKKVRDTKKSGASVEEVYAPKLWYFHLLHFLDDQEAPRASRCNVSDEDSIGNNEEEAPTPNVEVHDENTENVDVEDIELTDIETSTSPRTSNIHANRPRVLSRTKPIDNTKLTNEVLTTVNDHFKAPKKQDDRFDAFGKTIALRLRELPNDQRRWAEKFINDVLFEAEGGNLDNNLSLVRQMPQQYHHNFYPSPNFPPMRNQTLRNFPPHIFSPSSSGSPPPGRHQTPSPIQSPLPIPGIAIPSPSSQVFEAGLNIEQQVSPEQPMETNTLATYISEYNITPL